LVVAVVLEVFLYQVNPDIMVILVVRVVAQRKVVWVV
jgi:hypothetical protein